MIAITKKHKSKRILSFILSMILVLSTALGAAGTVVLADEATTNEKDVTLNKTAKLVDGKENTWDVTLSLTGEEPDITETEVVFVIDVTKEEFKEAAKIAAEGLLTNDCTKVDLVTYGNSGEQKGQFSDLDSLKNAIDGIKFNFKEKQFVQAGLLKAKEYLDSSTASKKNIILFSDGEATRSYKFSTVSINIEHYCDIIYHWSFFSYYPEHTWKEKDYDDSWFKDDYHINAKNNYEISSLDYSNPFDYNDKNSFVDLDAASKTCRHGESYKKTVHIDNAIAKATKYVATQVKNAGYDIYNVRCESNYEADDLLGKDNIKSSVRYKSNDYFNTFAEALAGSKKEITNATVTEVVSENFNLVNASNLTDSNGNPVTYDEATNKLTWSVDTVSSKPATLTYRVEVKNDKLATLDKNTDYSISKTSSISYTNKNGATINDGFPEATVNVSKRSIKLNFNEVDENGNVIATKKASEYVSGDNSRSSEYSLLTYAKTYVVKADDFTSDNYVLKSIDYNGHNYTDTDKVSVVLTADNSEQEVTFNYYKKEMSKVTVNYYENSYSKDATPKYTETIDLPVGSNVTLTAEQMSMHKPDGYVTPAAVDSSSSTVVTLKDYETVVNVVYTKDSFPYTINYYKDEISEANLIGSDSKEAVEFGSEIKAKDVDVTLHKPDGYEDGAVQSTDLIITSDADKNVINVLYSTKSKIGYEVRYYHDSVDDSNLIDTYVNEDAVFETTIDFDVDLKKGEGYKSGVIQSNSATTVTSDRDNNIVYVVYEKDSFPYTINYYKKSASDEEVELGTVTGSAVFESTIDVDVNAKKPTEGYKEGVIVEGTTTAKAGENVIKVVYEKDSFPYTINYYKKSASDEEVELGTVTGSAVFESTIDVDVNAKKPTEGYKEGVIVEGTTTVKAGENVIKVVYDRDTFGYTVNYYKDSVSEDNKLETDPTSHEALYDTVIKSEDVDLTMFKPDGYEAGVIETGNFTITANEANNVINVVYKTKSDVDYTIEYYKQVYNEDTDTITEKNIGTSVTGTAKFETPIEYIQSDGATRFATTGETDKLTIDLGAYLEAGYKSEVLVTGPEGDKLGLEDNTIKIVYQLEKYTITTEYYFDDEIDDSMTTTTEQYFATTINELTPYAVEGYELATVEYPESDTLSGDVTIKVNYKKLVVPEVAADEDTVLAPAADTVVAPVAEVAADEEIVEEVAADEAQTGDTNNMFIYFMAIMLSAGCLVVTGNKYFKKED
ncbi:vWA domain-containing protein [Lachnospira multipara]|uniref:vWA domain-containing protein n=1 Tax=Lachnospira multipara TaxID=28051 RepID=UPI00041086C6|nr:vWA domain-containing protein [Lachnospira multipara]